MMKSNRVRYKIIIIISIVLVLGLLTSLIFNKNNIRERLLIYSEKDVYDENWELEDIYIGKDSPTYMSFEDKNAIVIMLLRKKVTNDTVYKYNINLEDVSDIFRKFEKTFFENNKEVYEDYILCVRFYNRSGCSGGNICVLYYYKGEIYIDNVGWRIKIDDLAEKFPETVYINNNLLLYEDLNSIRNFNDLRYLNVRRVINEEDFNAYMKAETYDELFEASNKLNFSDEERNVISSYFPDCIIEK